MAALTVGGDSQLGYALFWQTVAAWVGLSLLVVWYMRKGLANLAASRMVPVQVSLTRRTGALCCLHALHALAPPLTVATADANA